VKAKDSRVYWDSCVFIDRIEAINKDRIDTLRAMTEAAEGGSLDIFASALVLAEVVKLSGLGLENAEKEQLILDFFENDYISVRNVDHRVSEIARRVVRDHKLKPPDAIHVATALLSKVDVLQTYDEPLIALDGKIFYQDVFDKPLRIEHPKWSWQPSLALAPSETQAQPESENTAENKVADLVDAPAMEGVESEKPNAPITNTAPAPKNNASADAEAADVSKVKPT